MEIIPFANTVDKKTSKMNLLMNEVAAREPITLGNWRFTCPRCDTALEFSAKGMIFRSIEIYCESCGAPHRIHNPAFTK